MPDVADLRKRYPKGTRLKLLRGISDPFTPKKRGEVMTVSFVDDAGQVHGVWDSVALIAGLDVFEVTGG